MKELHGQTLSNELAESDRLAAGIPGQVAAKNILFSKFWAQLKSIFGVNNWSAREYKSSPCIVVYNKAQYILDESVAPLPFNSTDFTTELASNIWLPLGSSITLASQSEAESNTENTKFLSSLRTFQNWYNNVKTYAIAELNTTAKNIVDAINELLVKINLNQQLINQKFDDLPIWKEDLTAWTTLETTVNLTSHLFRDFGTTPVTILVTITKTDAPSPYLSHYAFKFKYGTGGSFNYTGVHSASGNPTLTNGKYYEASIIRGELIYKEVQ